jgi:hypothetical protein
MTEMKSGTLRTIFNALPPGPISNTADIDRLLADKWDNFTGDDGGMQGYKLLNRMEDVVWSPPKMTFKIERHGGMVQGSTRAEIQEWELDLDTMTGTFKEAGRRQLSPQQPPVRAKPIAEEIGNLILAGKEDARLDWLGAGEVRVLIGTILPQDSAVKETLTARRKRFREELQKKLAGSCWQEAKAHTWKK